MSSCFESGETHQVADLSGTASKDENDLGAASRAAALEIVAGDAAAEELAGFEASVLTRGEGGGRGGEKSSGDGELHFEGYQVTD